MAPGFDIFLLLFEQTNNLLQLCRFSSLAWLCSRAPFCSRGCLNWFCSVSQNKWGAWLWVWSPQLLWLKFSAPKDGGAAFRLTDEHIFITREIGNMAYWAERKKRKKKKRNVWEVALFFLLSIVVTVQLKCWWGGWPSGSLIPKRQASLPFSLLLGADSCVVSDLRLPQPEKSFCR